MEYHIEKEEKLMQLFGYHAVGPDISNCWMIVDDQEQQVGYIQYKRVKKAHKKKGTPNIYGYVTQIESDIIHYADQRNLGDETLDYKFDLKKENGKIDHVEMNFGMSPFIRIWSQDYGYIAFSLDDKKLYCEFYSKTEHYNTNETIIVKHYNKQYSYTLTFCDKDKNILESEGTQTFSIQVTDKEIDNLIEVNDMRWIGNQLKYTVTSHVEGTLLEAIQKHQMGLEAFHHFCYIINQAVLLKEDTITELLQDRPIVEPEYQLFLSDFSTIKDHLNEEKQYIKK